MATKLGLVLGLIAALVVLATLAWLWLLTGIWVSSTLHTAVLAAGLFGSVAVVCLFLPNALIPYNRRWAGRGLVVVSYIWGAGLWTWATLVLFGLWGFGGMFVGLVLLGVGSVPTACLALLWSGEFNAAGQLAMAVSATFGLRGLGQWIQSKAPPDVDEARLSDPPSYKVQSRQPSTGAACAPSPLLTDIEVVHRYGDLLTRIGECPDGPLINRESELPYSRERIESALLRFEAGLVQAKADGLKPPFVSLHGQLAALDAFVPDAEYQPTLDLLERVFALRQAKDLQALSMALEQAPEVRRRAVQAVFHPAAPPTAEKPT